MPRYSVSIQIPDFIDWVLVTPVLLLRRLWYGYRFKRIALTRGKYALVDVEDYEKVNQYKWYVRISNKSQTYYAARTVNVSKRMSKPIAMHRVIINAPANMLVDHINGNGWDNRKANLRLANIFENARNKPKRKNTKLSKYKGVKRNGSGRWHAVINCDRKRIYLGTFETEEQAAKAYDLGAKKYHGEFANFNFSG